MGNKRIIIFGFILAGVLVAFMLDKVIFWVLDAFKLPNFQFFGLLNVSFVVGVIIAVVIAYFVYINPQVQLFFNEVVTELKKVTWPTRKETTGSTAIVLAVVLVFSVILGFFDFLWSKLIHLFLA